MVINYCDIVKDQVLTASVFLAQYGAGQYAKSWIGRT
jgi:hypothetical protein